MNLNGQLKNTNSNPPTGEILSTSDPVFIGKDYTGNFFNGSIDEVVVWNTDLGQAAITSLFSSISTLNVLQAAPVSIISTPIPKLLIWLTKALSGYTEIAPVPIKSVPIPLTFTNFVKSSSGLILRTLETSHKMVSSTVTITELVIF